MPDTYAGNAHPDDRFAVDIEGCLWFIANGGDTKRLWEPETRASASLMIATYENKQYIRWQ